MHMTESDILQDYLDRIATAVLTGDWATYEAGVVLPFHLVTHAANITVATQDDLRAGFDAFHQTLQIQRVTDFIRLVETAKLLDKDLISGRYVTHLMAGSHRIIPPYTSQITLRRQDGIWRAASITNALANSRWPLLMPSVVATSPKEGPIT
jgi:hypothetical protein